MAQALEIDEDVKDFGDYRDKYVDEIVEYIKTHYADPMRISDLAANLGISESYLVKIFKMRTGYSINEFIVRQRMRVAMRLLKDNSLSISQVGDMVGYKDSGYFSEIFKRSFAITPLDFKKGVPPKKQSNVQ